MTTRDDTELRRASLALALKFTGLILVLFALLGGVVYVIVTVSLNESTQRTLRDTARIDSPADAPPGVFVAIRQGDRLLASHEPPPGLPDTAAFTTVADSGVAVESVESIDGQDFRVRTSMDGPRVIQVAVSLSEGQEELQRLLWALVVTGVLAAVAAAVIAAWMARRAMRPLADALGLQRRFVMDASHELRTPLTLLSTRAQLLRRRLPGQEDAVTKQLATGIDELVQDSRALNEILEDLLVAADPREIAEKLKLDLAGLADEAVSGLQAEAEARGIALTRTGSAIPVMAPTARVSMQRLFTALISNALDHARSQVRVDVASEDKDVVIRVIDDGPGFPSEVGEHAFERFASARPSDSGDRQRHYGLGLALVADVASRHGGTVGIEQSTTEGGAIVAVRLPTHT
jgi:two-component system, OmpR family, sensor kinase